MEFHDKLRELRKSKGLTQEELAEVLYVSRTAVSKWESGRGYPGIDSLKEISKYFSVSIDDLLSGEKLLSIAEKEKRTSIRSLCGLVFGFADLFSFLLIVLPLYPKRGDGYIGSVNLVAYSEISYWRLTAYWIVFLSLFVCGCAMILLSRYASPTVQRSTACVSTVISILTVIFLALSREAYAATLAFLLLTVKGALLLKSK